MWVEPHDNNAPIQGYLVMYMEPEFVTGEQEREANISEPVEMVNITGLAPGVDYTFTVTAYNGIGESAPSDPLTVRTLDEGKSLPDENNVKIKCKMQFLLVLPPMSRQLWCHLLKSWLLGT